MSGMRIAVLASGGGTNLQSLVDHLATDGSGAGEIVWVGSNRADAGALVRAAKEGIACGVIVDHSDGDALLAQLRSCNAELLVLAGYLKLVPRQVVQAFHGRMMNVHPALLPAFGGAGMYGMRIHEAVIASGATVSGVTVHFVDDEYDRGAIIAQWPVPVLHSDSASALAARVLKVEHRIFPLCVELVSRGVIALGEDGKRVVRASPSAGSESGLKKSFALLAGLDAPPEGDLEALLFR